MNAFLEEPPHADISVGILSEISEKLDGVLGRLTRADEWGAIDAIQRVSWAAGGSQDFNERGNFRSVIVVNENDFAVTVGLAPGAGARAGGPETLAIPARGWLSLPARGVTVSVGAASAGSATVIPLAVTMPFAMGAGGTAGTAAGNPSFVSPATGATFDVSDRIARLVGRTSYGVADSLLAGGKVTAPALGAAIATLAAPPAGKYAVRVSISVSAASDLGNAELRAGAGVILPALGDPSGELLELVLTMNGSTALSVNATAAGTASVIYAARIVATRLE